MAMLARELGGSDSALLLSVAATAWNMRDPGNQWSSWPALLSFFRHVAHLDECGVDYSKWAHFEAAAIHAGPRFMHRDFCIVSDRPEVLTVDAENRPHNDTGPFCRWRDGISLYAIHGVYVPRFVVENPEQITVEKIHAERNEELKRIMIERYGLTRYVRDAKFKILDEDKDPLGQSRRLLQHGDLLVVELVNSTVDADGTRRVYHVPCEGELRPMLPDRTLGVAQKLTCQNAVASTFGLTGDRYRPDVET